MAQSGFLDLGTIIELVTGAMNNVKPKTADQKGYDVDYQKLALLAGSVLGRRAISYVIEQRTTKRDKYDEAVNILRTRSNLPLKEKKPKSNSFRNLILGGVVVAGAVYLLVMKPEDRAALFQKVDDLINQVTGLVNEFQGKPYSNDFEQRRGA